MKFFVFLCAFVATSVFAKPNVVQVDASRTVYIEGIIDGFMFPKVNEIERLADGSGAPINLVINSKGGNVIVGSQILSVINIAKTRGHKVNCYVPMLAASMAYQILVNCDNRYALKYAILLWHPMKLVRQNAYSERDMLYSANRLRAWERPWILEIIRAMKINTKTFFYHYNRETIWMAYELAESYPRFIKVVDDIQGLKTLFPK